MQYRSRDLWKSRFGIGYNAVGTKGLVVLHHSYLPSVDCGKTVAAMDTAIRGIETFHVLSNGWNGIGYNWCVFQSGHIYEARGWGRIGAHTAGQNSKSVGICLIIDGDSVEPTDAALESVAEIIKTGIQRSYISPKFELKGHKDFGLTSCPGKLVYSKLASIRAAALK